MFKLIRGYPTGRLFILVEDEMGSVSVTPRCRGNVGFCILDRSAVILPT